MNGEIPSPCVNVCILDADKRLCTGCGRTLGEIGEWGRASETRRRAILARLAREWPGPGGKRA